MTVRLINNDGIRDGDARSYGGETAPERFAWCGGIPRTTGDFSLDDWECVLACSSVGGASVECSRVFAPVCGSASD